MKKIVITGIVVFLFTAILQAPLGFLRPHIEKQFAGVKLEGVSGTLWNGEILNLSKNGTQYGKVRWKISPFDSLKALALRSDFSVNGKLLKADGNAGVTPTKTLILDQTRFELNAQLLNQMQQQANLGGELSGTIQHATFSDGEVPLLDGLIEWDKATVRSKLLNLQPGNYQFRIQPEPDGLLVTPRSTEAPLEIGGTLKLDHDWISRPDLRVKASDPGLGGLLAFAGKPQADGTVHITNPLDLKPFMNKR